MKAYIPRVFYIVIPNRPFMTTTVPTNVFDSGASRMVKEWECYPWVLHIAWLPAPLAKSRILGGRLLSQLQTQQDRQRYNTS